MTQILKRNFRHIHTHKVSYVLQRFADVKGLLVHDMYYFEFVRGMNVVTVQYCFKSMQVVAISVLLHGQC